MPDSVAGVALGAGAGVRLRPLTILRPKVLCPVGDRPLIDHAIARFAGTTDAVAVNVHHGRDLLEHHLADHHAGRVHISVEEPEALGTAGALAALRDWIDGRPVIAVNADTWTTATVGALVDGWDGDRCRVLVPAGDTFAAGVTIAGALLPWSVVRDLAVRPSGLYESVWVDAAAADRLDVVHLAPGEPCVDCGSPRAYLEANLAWSSGASVVGEGAIVHGTVAESVVWPGATVRADEHLERAIRADARVTVLVR
jgi:hypothetical protein